MTANFSNSSLSSTTYRSDYSPPNYWVDTVSMVFDLHPTHTCITSTSTIRHRKGAPNTLKWVGDSSKGGVLLESISLNGIQLNIDDINGFNLDQHTGILTILNMPNATDTDNEFITVEIKTTVNPTDNTALMGLYASQGNLFTQCEAHGFRRLTYAPDRPDVMSRYTVTLYADKDQYPVLLSNGNLIASGDCAHSNKHYAVWQDPYLKPSYLFAVVAGDLTVNETWIDNPHIPTGQSLLQIYTRSEDTMATQWALDCLKASIAWDLNTFGRHLDLERYMVVAVGDFNMGAMENKGLNIFNTAYVLAQPDTATDTDYSHIESVIGHEYFHNWTGNRITCRDWFQLTLKEGLTVYRDQLFSADQLATAPPKKEGIDEEILNQAYIDNAKAVCRINDVIAIRGMQFGEDSGPMAHSIRPNSFEDISNFYTATVYEKGAEVIRMQALLANAAIPNGFKKGMAIYFSRHDGQAVTCDDFLQAISDGSGVNLNQFKRWYEQAGTPTVKAWGLYDAVTKQYTLTLTQHNPAVGIEINNTQLTKLPLHIPVLVSLLNTHTEGNQEAILNTLLNGHYATEHLLHLTQTEQVFVFEQVISEPTPSLLRNFSAPVKLQYNYTNQALLLLLAYDTDSFNRWEAIQRLYECWILSIYNEDTNNQTTILADSLCILLMNLLDKPTISPAFKAILLNVPNYNILADKIGSNLRPYALYTARELVLNQLANGLKNNLPKLYVQFSNDQPYRPDAHQIGMRALRNAVLLLWLRIDTVMAVQQAKGQYRRTHNMTNRMAALEGLLFHTGTMHSNLFINNIDTELPELEDFYLRFENNELVIDKWFALQASSPYISIEGIQILINHPAFKWTNPNRMRSVVFKVCFNNPVLFHSEAGYTFWLNSLKQLIIINPDIAARLARAMDIWRNYEPALSNTMHRYIQQALNIPNLPKGVGEILNKSLLNS